MDVIEMLLKPEFLILALILNFVIAYFRNLTEKFFDLKKVPMIRQLFQGLLFFTSFGITVLAIVTGQLPLLIANSIWITASWIAIVSMIIYDIGIKDIMRGIRAAIIKKLRVK